MTELEEHLKHNMWFDHDRIKALSGEERHRAIIAIVTDAPPCFHDYSDVVDDRLYARLAEILVKFCGSNIRGIDHRRLGPKLYQRFAIEAADRLIKVGNYYFARTEFFPSVDPAGMSEEGYAQLCEMILK